MYFKNKRLLILGGTRLMVHVVDTAKRMGVYTIVTDMDPNSPAKRFSDKCYNISTSNIDEIVNMAKMEHIDGVFAGYDDQNTGFAVEICKRLGLHFYANKEQIQLTKNKIEFKNLCRSYNVPVVVQYDNEHIVFPCVVKPADSYSSKGITICYNDKQLNEAINFAKSFSKSGQYLIEKYMDSESSNCVNIDYIIVDGKIVLSIVGDKYVIRQENKAPLTDVVVYPSKYAKEFIDEVDEKIKRMFESLNMKNGVAFIEAFHDDNGFAIYEMGYRVGGGQSSILVNKIYGIDYIEMLINYALTGRMIKDNSIYINPIDCQDCCGLVVLVKPGTIKKIEGLDSVRAIPGVINITQYLYEGDTIENKLLGTLGQTFARIHIIANNRDDLVEKMRLTRQILHVFSDSGNDMIVK
jgi:biotin carboxylase